MEDTTMKQNIQPNDLTFFPVVNFITGPPGILRNGGIWKFVKSGIVNELQLPSLMTQVLHFTDFGVSKRVFDKWFKEGKTLKDWISEINPSYRPVIFADSGGFKLLYNSEYDLSSYGIRPTPESIFKLQMAYGADYVASLDYPIPPNLNKKEAKDRMDKSIKNAIKLMELVYDDYDVHTFPYLAVHGRNSSEIKEYLNILFKELEESGFNEYKRYPFGLAIGSMVPIKNHYELIVEIVYSLKDTLQNQLSLRTKIPIHIFGISGKVIPFLYYLGIDSFDSNTYVKSAQNLRFFTSLSRTKNFYGISHNDLCNCTYCQRLSGKNLQQAKKVLLGKSYSKHEFNGRLVIKSEIYAYIALHNLSLQLSVLDELKRYNPSSIEFKEWLVEYAKADNRLVRVLSKLAKIDTDFQEISGKHNIKLPKIDDFYEYSQKKEISLSLDPNQFNIGTMQYSIDPYKKVILILTCTSKKPYSKSRTHEQIFKFLKNSGIDISRIEKVTLSGLFGPVPERFESYDAILRYDYMLSSKTPKDKIELLVKRLVTFIEQHHRSSLHIIAYVASKPYRNIIKKAQKELRKKDINIILLPENPTKEVGGEVLKKKNLKELASTLGSILQ